MVNTLTRSACHTFALTKTSALSEQYAYVSEMRVLPSNPDMLIAIVRTGTSFYDHQLAVFENGIRWPSPIGNPLSHYSGVLSVCQDDSIFTMSTGTDYPLTRYQLGDTDLTPQWTRSGMFSFSGYYSVFNLECSNGMLFGSSGTVIDPERIMILGDTAGTGPVAVDQSGSVFYQMSSRTSVVAYSAAFEATA